ncbi:MAG TPA: phenylalanine--tRNA ligase subunit alpha [Anaerolineaceae bacterium]|nr:phenylalanine--tRNA ligase subunit alpha [Anaerolineaceae bacterium]
MDGTEIMQELDQIQQAALEALSGVEDEAGLQTWRSAYISRSAPVMLIFSRLPEFPKELRPQVGQQANRVKQALEAAQAEKAAQVKQSALQRALANERLDVTLPGRRPSSGRLHPATQALDEICRVLGGMGFQVYPSPEVESDEYNFELLNIPAYHPARDMWDTFHTNTPSVVLRTHTSPGQIRAMRQFAPQPLRMILPGMVFRYEQTDASHESQFNQVELLAVGKGITFANLKATIDDFVQRMFGEGTRTRLRPSYFPFTEPSAEIDVECFLCGGKGCAVCKTSGWLEIGGCGMVHPIVLRNGGYDPNEFSGFAAGLGPERVAMLRYHIREIRNFWANDVRFLEQF